MKYRSWNYFQSPMIYDMYLSVVVAYGMYVKMSEGEFDQTWKDDNIVELWKF